MTRRAAQVVMVVNNGMANDARVIKSANTLHRAGAAVTVLGVASAGAPRAETAAAGVRYVRLPTFPARGWSPAYLGYAARRRLGRLAAPSDWARSLPAIRRYTRAFVADLRALDPDVVHVHDVHLLDAVAQAWPDGRRPRILYDAHEYVAGLAVSGARTQRAVDGWAALERDRIHLADVVVTVAPAIAARLAAEHALAAPPVVVLNAPLLLPHPRASRDLRGECGVAPGTPLLVYSGAVSAARGLDVAIEALRELPEVHLAVVAVPFPHPMAPDLAALARRVGVAERVHFAPPVPSTEVPGYLAAADAGLSPIHGDAASYDLALPNKLFEFVHAGLPIVTSDLAGMSAFVTEHRLGAVFRQGNPQECARAIREALSADDRPDTTELEKTFSWQAQEPALIAAYAQLLGGRDDLVVPVLRTLPWPVDSLAPEFG